MERQGVERRYLFVVCSLRSWHWWIFHVKLAKVKYDASVIGTCDSLVTLVNNVTCMTTPSKGVIFHIGWGFDYRSELIPPPPLLTALHLP